jgi:hypothetical protein
MTVKRGVVQSLYYRATFICQEQKIWSDEIVALKYDIQVNACPTGSINFVMSKPKRNVLLKKEMQPLGFISIFYIRGVSENFKLKRTDTILKLCAK